MRCFRVVAFAVFTFVVAALAGCGSSNGGTSSDPFATNKGSTTGTATDPQVGTIFGNISTSTGRTGITLRTDTPSVDIANGQVLAIATVVSSGGAVAGVPVTFAVDGPATVESGLTTVTTDSNGTAITRITTGNVPSTTNVIISASVRVGTQNAIAKTSVQIIRGGGVIMFDSAAGIKPGGQDNIIGSFSAEVESSFDGYWNFLNLIAFKLTDSNGNPRVGVPVTISVYSTSISSMNPNDINITIDFLVPPITEPDDYTITTDSAGQGLFNASALVRIPSIPGNNTAANVVFKAVTHDPIPVTAYGGIGYSIHKKLAVNSPTNPGTTASSSTGYSTHKKLP